MMKIQLAIPKPSATSHSLSKTSISLIILISISTILLLTPICSSMKVMQLLQDYAFFFDLY